MSRLPFARQMLLLQLLVVVAVIVLATATYGVLATVAHRESAESTALAIARTVAENADLQTAVTEETEDPAAADGGALALGPVQLIAESARSRTGALFVVVTDDRGMRLAHPNAALLGQRVSTDPAVALGGHEETSWERGTLGDSARAKVPVRGQDGTVVGEVSVGFGAAGVFDSAAVDLGAIAIVAASAVLLGALASAVLARRLNRQTLGLQPSELAGMVHDQAAVLGGIGEGVLGIAADGRVSVCNARAATLLNLEEPIGRPVGALALPDQLLAALTADTRTAQTLRLVVEDRLLFADVSRVDRDGIDLGSVVVVRDETDVEAMAQRLSAVSAMTSALRVQRHEFANRLHVVSGLLETGRTAEARSYVAGVLERGPVSYPVHGSELLTEPYLQAFVGAKAMEAGERGVAVRIGPGTLVLGTLVRPEEVTTVLGTAYRVVRLSKSHQNIVVARLQTAAYLLAEELRSALEEVV